MFDRFIVTVTSSHFLIEEQDWDGRPTGRRVTIPLPKSDHGPISLGVRIINYGEELEVTLAHDEIVAPDLFGIKPEEVKKRFED